MCLSMTLETQIYNLLILAMLSVVLIIDTICGKLKLLISIGI